MRVLVTGGAGFIGSNFVEHLTRNLDRDVIVFDKFTYAGRMANLEDFEEDIRIIRGDVADEDDIENIVKETDVVYHFAAESHVDNSIDSPLPFIQTNVVGTFRLLEAIRKHSVETFVHISTDEVYGSAQSDTFSEDDAFDPSSPYSASKASAELLCSAYEQTYDLPVVVARPSNTFGPRQNPEKLIPKMILRALHDQPLPVYGDGGNVRTWTHVSDVCNAIYLIGEESEPGEAYNIATGEEWRNIDVVRAILDRLGKPEENIEFVEDRPGHDFRYSLDTSRIEELGWHPEIDFGTGLVRTIDWYMSNEDWWGPLFEIG